MLNRVALTHLLRELYAAGYSGPSSYDRAYRKVLNGAIPAEQVTSNRWEVLRANFPVAAAALGLNPPTLQPINAAAAEQVAA